MPVSRASAALGLIAALILPGGPTDADAATKVEITISNFQYCQSDICTFANHAYLRPTVAGPVLEDVVVNPQGVVEVRRGDTVTWTYRDTTWCDNVAGCPGHDVVFEDGKTRSPLLKARDPKPQLFRWKVPKAASPNTLVLYYCSLPGPTPYAGHSDIMTGALKIVS